MLVLRIRGDMPPLHHVYCLCSAYSSTGIALPIVLSFTWQEVHMVQIFKRVEDEDDDDDEEEEEEEQQQQQLSVIVVTSE